LESARTIEDINGTGISNGRGIPRPIGVEKYFDEVTESEVVQGDNNSSFNKAILSRRNIDETNDSKNSDMFWKK
jgi:hypothetical protein